VYIPHHLSDSSAAPINCAVATAVNAVSQVPSMKGKSPMVARTALVQVSYALCSVLFMVLIK
jgi:D-arabinose 1-dehydrogenase-like Zn-dependent alcohol dehydrogenase